jgi:hypothetical protein
MNAPKKIWYSFEYEKRIIAGANEEDTPYIRADLVEKLRSLIQEEVDWIDKGEEPGYGSDWHLEARVALAALKEEE